MLERLEDAYLRIGRTTLMKIEAYLIFFFGSIGIILSRKADKEIKELAIKLDLIRLNVRLCAIDSQDNIGETPWRNKKAA